MKINIISFYQDQDYERRQNNEMERITQNYQHYCLNVLQNTKNYPKYIHTIFFC